VSDLNIVVYGAGDVHIQHMECDVCKVQTERGSCTLQSVKVTLSIYLKHIIIVTLSNENTCMLTRWIR